MSHRLLNQDLGGSFQLESGIVLMEFTVVERLLMGHIFPQKIYFKLVQNGCNEHILARIHWLDL